MTTDGPDLVDPVDPDEPLPVQTDNSPRPEDGDQSGVSQDPTVSYETLDDAPADEDEQ